MSVSNNEDENKGMERDKQFIKNLYHHLTKKSTDIYALKRSFGRNVKEDVNVYLSFLKISGECVDKAKEDIYFLIACMFYQFERPSDEKNGLKYVKFETLIGRIYNLSDTTDKKIAAFLDTDYDDNGVFVKQFVRLANRCKRELYAGECLDYTSLLTDIKLWNLNQKRVRFQWAERISKNSKGE